VTDHVTKIFKNLIINYGKLNQRKGADKMSFWNDLKSQVKDMSNKQIAETGQKNERKKEMDEKGEAYCPKCLSTSLSTQKKGGSIAKGLVGGALLGPVGLLTGGIGRNKVDVVCMKCGNKFKA